MKKIFFLAAMMLALASCTNSIDNENSLRMRQVADADILFYAVTEGNEEDGPETKVYADSQMRVLWNANDQITIFNKNTYNQPYRFKGEDGDNAGGFAKVPTDEFTTGSPIENIYAVYPYQEPTEFTYEGEIGLTLPALQTYKKNSFGIGANTMVAATTSNMLQFKNVCGYLSFKFFGDGIAIKSITFKGNNHEKIAGDAFVTMPLGGTPSVTMQDTATEEVTLECATPVALGADAQNYTEFWFVIPPTNFTQGISVTVTDAIGGTFAISTTNSVTITRSNISHMEPAKVVPTYEFVPFKDANFKAYCVENFDTDEDGQISLSEALVPTAINVNTANITSFAGIEYFSNLTSLQCTGGFDFTNNVGLGQLTELDLSNNTKLIELTCSENNLSSLDISKCQDLRIIRCHNNKLTALDVSNNKKLYSLSCGGKGGNLLTSLDLSQNTELELLACANNKLSSLDLSRNKILYYLVCSNNQITSLDVSKNTALTDLYCENNPSLTEIWLMMGQTIETFQYDKGVAAIKYKGVPEAVDLGLPSGILWASVNLGAGVESDYGSRFAWGEIKTKGFYDWTNYKWCNGTATTMNKYCTSAAYGSVDGKTILEDDDDAAIAIWGGNWRMPTVEEANELLDNCTWTDETQGNVKGSRVTGPNGKSIFLPWNGQFDESGLHYVNQGLGLWLNQCNGQHLGYTLGSDRVLLNNHRHDGLCIRPVYQKGVHKPVDLGLPSGIKWASVNLGASEESDYGDRFAWGEIETKTFYNWTNYKWCNGTETTMNKYCTSASYGSVDGKTILEDDDDAAIAIWGGKWRMPTVEEANELLENCTWTDETQGNVKGSRVTGPNGKSIFLPWNGQFDESGLQYVNQGLGLWLNQCNGQHLGYTLGSDSILLNNHRHDGLCIRPVLP